MLISDGKARRIASEWHSGMSSPFYAFASCGVITEDVIEAARRELRENPAELELKLLHEYVKLNGIRPVVDGWSRHWED